MNEKIHGQFYLDEQALEFIASVASFYNISRSEVVAWAIDASVKSFEKAYKQATRRLYKRQRCEYEKTKKVQATPSRAHKTKATSPQNAPIQQLAFNFTAREAAEPFGANKFILHGGQR